MLDYVWPAVDAFLRAGLDGDLVTVLPNCRSVCVESREQMERKQAGEASHSYCFLQVVLERIPERRKGGMMAGEGGRGEQ